jgi:hypothetical protein
MLDNLITVKQFKLRKERMDVCFSCEYKVDNVVSICSVCNCILKIKTIFSDAKCPKGKW